jgi:hypothetical protein
MAVLTNIVQAAQTDLRSGFRPQRKEREQGLHTLLPSGAEAMQPGENCGFGNGEISA